MKKSKIWFWVTSGLVLLLAFFIPQIYYRFYIGFFIEHFSGHRYIEDELFSRDAMLANFFLFIAFSGVAYYWNLRTLKQLDRQRAGPLLAFSALDQLAVPLGILLMVIWNNRKAGYQSVSTLLNPVIIGIFLLLKHIIMFLITGKYKRPVPPKNNLGNGVKRDFHQPS